MKEIPGLTLSTNAASAAPTGNVGLDMTGFTGAARPKRWLLTISVTAAASNLTLWGALAAGAKNDATDDTWGVVQDRYKQFPLGVIGTAVPVGTYHFFVDDIGNFSRLYCQNSAGTVTLKVTEIYEMTRGT